jgi:hypothetical protein
MTSPNAPVVSGVWRGPQALSALGVIAVMLVWRSVLVGDSFFNQDDYYLTSRALDSDLTWSFLMHPVAGHVMPAQQLTYWLVAHNFPFDWPTMALLLVIAQGATTVVMWHLLSRLLPGRWVRVPLLAVFAWSPMTLATGLWWSAAMGLWPHVLCSLLGMLFLVRAIQGAGPRWLNLTGCVAVTVFALAWHERAVLIPPTLLGVAIVLSGTSGLRRVLVALRQFWVLWATFAVMLVAYLAAHAQITTVEAGSASIKDYLAISWSFLAENTAPGLASGPWDARLVGGAVFPDLWVTVTSLILLAAVAAFLVRRGGQDAVCALVVLTAYVLVDLALVLSGRAGFGRIIGLDPRYTSDIVLAAVPLVAMAIRGAPARFGLPLRGRASWSRVRAAALLGITGAYLLGSAFGVALLVPHFQNPDDRAYITRVRAELAEDPEQVLFDEPVPPDILLPLLGDETLLSAVLAPLPERPLFDAPSPKLRQVTQNGSLVKPELVLTSEMRPTDEPDCGYAVSADPVRIPLEKDVEGRTIVHLGYFTDRESDVRVTADDWSTQFRARVGPNEMWLVVPDLGEAHDAVTLEVAGDKATTECVPSLEAGLPLRP